MHIYVKHTNIGYCQSIFLIQISFQNVKPTEISEDVCARVTRVMKNSMIVRIHQKRRLFECCEDILKTVEDSVPCKRSLKIVDGVVVNCSECN